MEQAIGSTALPGVLAGVRWRICAVAVAALALLTVLAPAARAGTNVRVVVVGELGAGVASKTAVEAVGGKVVRRLPLINGVVARVPARALDDLRRAAGVRAAELDRPFRLHGAETDAASSGVTLAQVREAMGIDGGDTGGAGVDVALIDSGITPVPGLDDPSKVVNGPDLSADRNDETLRHLDAFGHGTHLAGIIAAGGAGQSGIAPASRLVNVKVADSDGATSLSRLMIAIDWVARNRSRDGLNIRVLNLAFGADTSGGYRDDPLAFAVEQAWRRGIVVVAAAGNGGHDSTSLDTPAVDPYVLAVGSQDMLGTVTRDDDVVADFSSRGTAERSPDVLAPGVGIVSLAVTGGHLDELFPNARVGEGGFRGSGTSQSAAAASGAVAVLLQRRPELTADEVKAVLRGSAEPLAGADATLQGAGVIRLGAAASLPVTTAAGQSWLPARGGGPWRASASASPPRRSATTRSRPGCRPTSSACTASPRVRPA